MGIFTGKRIEWRKFQKTHHPGIRCQGHAIGNYIVDFVSIKKKLIIELDGSQHLEQEEYDLERTATLESQGYQVIRFWNNDVMNDINSAIRAIDVTLRGKRTL